jgi:Ca2+-binding RTX toxin-like protein
VADSRRPCGRAPKAVARRQGRSRSTAKPVPPPPAAFDGDPWNGLETLEQRLLLSIDLNGDAVSGIQAGFDGLAGWGDTLDSSGLMTDLLPLVDQDHRQAADAPQDPALLYTLGTTVDAGGILGELHARAVAYFAGDGTPTSAELATYLGGMAVGDGTITIAVTDNSAGDEAVFDVTLTRTRADVADVPLDLGADAEALGVAIATPGVTVDVTPALTMLFQFGYHTAQADADVGFWLNLDALSAGATIDDGAGAPVTLPDFDLRIGVLGTHVSGAQVQMAAGAQAAFTAAIAGDGEVTLGELRDSFASGQVTVTEGPGTSTALLTMPAAVDAGFEAGAAPADGTITLGSATQSIFGHTVTQENEDGDPEKVLVRQPLAVPPDMLVFGALQPRDLLAPMLRFAAFLDSLGDSGLYRQPLPFVQGMTLAGLFGSTGSVSDALGLGNALRDEVLSSPIVKNPPVESDSEPDFTTIQELVAQDAPAGTMAARYDSATGILTLEVIVPETAQTPVTAPFVCNVTLDAGLTVAVDANVTLTPGVGMDFTFGVDLKPADDAPAVTSGPVHALPQTGRLSADAHFTLTIAGTAVDITVAKADTDGNTSVADLVADVQAAVAAAVAIALPAKSVTVSLDSSDGNRLAFTSDQGDDLLLFVDDRADTAFTQLGMENGEVVLTAVSAPVAQGRLTADAVFNLTVRGTVIAVTVAQADTADNASLEDLVDDLQAALEQALGNAALPTDLVTAETATVKVGAAYQRRVALVSDRGLTVGAGAEELGFTAGQSQAPASPGPVVTAEGVLNTPATGRILGANLAFDLVLDDGAPVAVVIGPSTGPGDAAENLTNNVTAADLAADINAALVDAGLGALVEAVQAQDSGGTPINGVTIRFKAGAAGTMLSLLADRTDPAVTELGFLPGQYDVADDLGGFFFDASSTVTAALDMEVQVNEAMAGRYGFLGVDFDEAAMRATMTLTASLNPARAPGGHIPVDDLQVRPAIIIGGAEPDAAMRVRQDAAFTLTPEGEAPVVVTAASLSNSVLVSAATNAPAGQLSGNAFFDLAVGGRTVTVTVYRTLPDNDGDGLPDPARQTGTDNNRTLEQLALDVAGAIRDALEADGVSAQDAASMVTVTLEGNRLVLASRYPLTVSGPNGVGVAELGLAGVSYQFRATAGLTGDVLPPDTFVTADAALPANGQPAADATLWLRVGRTNITVTVLRQADADLSARQDGTAGNATRQNLVDDVQDALADALEKASLATDLVTASLVGDQLRLDSAQRISVRAMNKEAAASLHLVIVNMSPSYALSGDAHFALAIGNRAALPVTVTAAATAGNASAADLLADVQAALAAALTGAGLAANLVTANLGAGGQLVLTSAEHLSVGITDDAEPAFKELGLQNAFTRKSLTDAINRALADAGLGGRVTAGFVQNTDTGEHLLALSLNSPHQTLSLTVAGGSAAATQLGLPAGTTSSVDTEIGEDADGDPVLLGEPILAEPVYGGSLADDLPANPADDDAIDAIVRASGGDLQLVLTLGGTVPGVGAPAPAFNVNVTMTDLLDAGTRSATVVSDVDAVARHMTYEDVFGIVRDAGDYLLGLRADVFLLRQDLPILSMNATELINFVAPIGTLIDDLADQDPPATLQALEAQLRQGLNIDPADPIFTFSGGRLNVDLDFAYGVTRAAPFSIDLPTLNDLALAPPFDEPRMIVSADGSVRHDVTTRAQITLNLHLDYSGVADDADDPVGRLEDTSTVVLGIRSRADNLDMPVFYGPDRLYVTAGEVRLGSGATADGAAELTLALAPAGGARDFADIFALVDFEGIRAAADVAGVVLAGDATFTLHAGDMDIAVTLAAADTQDNASLDDLVEDLNAAIAAALDARGLPQDLVAALVVPGTQRLYLVSDGRVQIAIADAATNPAATVLGFADGQAGAVTAALVGEATAWLQLETRDDPYLGDLEIVVADLADAMDRLPGSVEFGTPAPDLDGLLAGHAGDENRLATLLRQPELLITGIDGVLDDIQTTIEMVLEPLGALPLVGEGAIDMFLEWSDDMRTARRRLRDTLLAQFQNEDIVETIAQALENAFGPAGLGVMVGGVVVTEGDTADDEFVQWDMHLRQEKTFTLPFEIGLGLQDLPGLGEGFPNFGFNIDASDGVEVIFAWDYYFGFGVSLEEGFYLNADAVGPDDAPTPEVQFSMSATLPETFSARMALGLVQSEVTNGLAFPARLTAADPIIVRNAAGDPEEFGNEFLDLEDNLLFKRYVLDFTVVIQRDGEAEESIPVHYDSLGHVSFIQFLLEFNQELMACGADLMPSADFGDVLHPHLVLTTRDPDVVSMRIEGGEEMGFMPDQVEDQRSVGLGFAEGQTSVVGAGGAQELVAERDAPTGGGLRKDTDFRLTVGTGAGATEVWIVLRKDLYDGLENLIDLAAAVQRRLDRALGQEGMDEIDKPVRCLVEGDRLKFVSATETLEITDLDLKEYTGLNLALNFDLVDPNAEDGVPQRLDLSELFGSGSLFDVIQPGFTGHGYVRFLVDSNTKHITDAAENLFGASGGSLGLPSLSFGLRIDVGLPDLGSAFGSFGKAAVTGVGGAARDRVAGKDTGGSFADTATNKVKDAASGAAKSTALKMIEKFQFTNVTLDVGDLLMNIVGPMASGISTILGPVTSLLGDGTDAAEAFLTRPLPLLDELGIDLTLMDALDTIGIGMGLRGIFNAVRMVETMEQTIETLGDTGELRFGCWEIVLNPNSPLYFPKIKIPVPCEVAESLDSLGLGESVFSADFDVSAEPAGFRLDILSIDSIVNWVMGEPFDIFSFSLGTLDLSGGLSVPFGVKIGKFKLGFEIDLDFGMNFDVTIGYDSTGIARIIDAYRAGGDPDWDDLLDGFYLRTVEGSEIGFHIDFSGRAGIGPIEVLGFTVFEASASVRAGIAAGLDVRDPNNDGKLRLDEIFDLTDDFSKPQNLACLFDAHLSVYGGFSFKITFMEVTLDSDDLPFPTSFSLSVSLSDLFGILGLDCPGHPPVLAQVVTYPARGDLPEEKVLLLNCGPFAHNRIYGDTDDSDNPVAYVLSTPFEGILSVAAFGYTQDFYAYDLAGVTRIVGYGTNFADTFDCGGMTRGAMALLPVHLDGKGDNDRIIGGAGADMLLGGLGDDTLMGGLGNDELRGGLGNDILWGGADASQAAPLQDDNGEDRLLGEKGDDILRGGRGNDTYVFSHSWGVDRIIEDEDEGLRDVIDMSLGLVPGMPADYTGRLAQVRRNLFITLAAGGTTITDLTHTITVESSAGAAGHPAGHRVEEIISGRGNDWLLVSATEPYGVEDFVTVLDGSNGSDTYRVYTGDPAGIPSAETVQGDAAVIATGILTQAQATFYVVVGNSDPLTVTLAQDLANGDPADLLDDVNAALAAAAVAAGFPADHVAATLVDDGAGGQALLFDARGRQILAVYAEDAADAAATDLGIHTLHGPLLGEKILLRDTGSTFDVDRLLAEGTPGDDVAAVTQQSVYLRRAADAEADASEIQYNSEEGGGIEVLEVRLRSGNDVANVESTAASTSVLLQGYTGNDIFNIGVDRFAPEHAHLDVNLESGPVDTTAGGPAQTGCLSAPATFVLEAGLFDPVTVTVPADATNASLDDLAADVQAAIAVALTAAGLDPGLVAVAAFTDGNGVDRFLYTSTETLALYTTVAADPAAAELGLPLARNLDAMRGSDANGPVRIEGGLGDDILNVFDTADAAGDAGVLDGDAITGLGMDQGVKYSEVEKLNIFLGEGDDTFTVVNTIPPTDIWGRAGNDTFLVEGSSASEDANIFAGTGDDLADFADGASIGGVYHGQGGADTVDYHRFSSSVRAELDTGRGTGVNRGFDGGLIDVENATGGPGRDWLIGSDADNVLIGGGENDVLLGLGGNDTLIGGAGDDFLYGYDGDDLLMGGDGNDSLFGEAGDDILDGGPGNDLANGGLGNDRYVLVPGSRDSLFDEGGTDLLDFTLALFGVDVDMSRNRGQVQTIDEAGNELALTGTFEDAIGSSFADTLRGNDAANTLYGGGGDDTLYGGMGNDTLLGQAGDDRLFGERGNDTLLGGDGNDSLDGGADDDSLDGGAGDDSLNGGAGSDTLIGGAGNDRIDGGAVRSDLDRVDHSADPAGVTVDLGAGTAVDGWGGTDTIANVRGAVGSAFGDTLTGTAGDDTLDGGAGDDTLDGACGNDTLFGGLGNDWLSGGAGNDTLHDGAGDDTLLGGDGNDRLYGAAGNDVFDGGAGDDFFFFSSSGGGPELIVRVFDPAGVDTLNFSLFASGVTVDTGAHSGEPQTVDAAGNVVRLDGQFENIVGSPFDDVLTGNSAANTIDGGAGDDRIIGGGGSDTLIGGDGSDTLDYSTSPAGVNVNLGRGWGYDGYDGRVWDRLSGFETLIGSPHDDTLAAGPGGATLYGGAGNDTLTGGAGADIIFGGLGSDVIDGGAGNDVLWGDAGNDTLRGGGGDDELHGGDGDDSLLAGRTGNATLYGDAGNDCLTGGGGNDRLFGGAGNDTLDGGWGNDFLAGGAGNDRFYGHSGRWGITVLDYSADPAGVTVDLGAGTATDGFGDADTFSGAGGVLGTPFDDHLTGTPGADWLAGGAGNNLLEGGLGNDTYAILPGGANSVTDTGGTDTLDFSGATAGVNVSLNVAAPQVIDLPGHTLTLTGDFENLIGSPFDDLLTGNNAANTFTGGAGDDTFVGLGGKDTFIGGDGNDSVDHSAAPAGVNVNLWRGWGTDGYAGRVWDRYYGVERLVGSPFDDTIYGGAGDDTLLGGAGNDTIRDWRGNNTLLGGLGNDTLTGGAGDDTLDGGDGDDRLEDSRGSNTLLGGDGEDFIRVTGGSGVLRGGAGDDYLEAQGGWYALWGDVGNDTLRGGRYDTFMFGGPGDDHLIGGRGADSMNGGAGNDILDGGYSRWGSHYWADYSSDPAGVTVDLAAGIAMDGFGGTDSLVNIGNVIGSPFNDVLIGDAADNTLIGDGGDDDLDGACGNDTLDGGAGANILRGGTGDDIFRLGAASAATLFDDGGNDWLAFYAAAQGVTVDLGQDAGQVQTLDAAGNTLALNGTFENVCGSPFNDVLIGNAADNTLLGGEGDDRLVGGPGHDTLLGGDGTDTVDYSAAPHGVDVDLGRRMAAADGTFDPYGRAVTDRIEGVENVIGSPFDDTLRGDAGPNVLDGLAGNDRLMGGAGDDTLFGRDGDDTLEGDAGNDALFGEAGDDTLDGGAGDDALFGGDGNDALLGGAGNDSLAGDDGDDDLAGDSGDDRLVGGLGSDTLRGGHGNDTLIGGLAGMRADGSWLAQDLRDTPDGADSLFGDTGDDRLLGGSMNDTLNGGRGNDILDGGTGDDTLADESEPPEFAGGQDLLIGWTGADALTADNRNDRLFGDEGDDGLDGGYGDDYLDAGPGDDVLMPGDGLDTLIDGAGNDTHVLPAP